MTISAHFRERLGLTKEELFVCRTSRYAVTLLTKRDSAFPKPRYRMKGLSGLLRDHSWKRCGTQGTLRNLGSCPRMRLSAFYGAGWISLTI
jgi:hypothetical protein